VLAEAALERARRDRPGAAAGDADPDGHRMHVAFLGGSGEFRKRGLPWRRPACRVPTLPAATRKMALGFEEFLGKFKGIDPEGFPSRAKSAWVPPELRGGALPPGMPSAFLRVEGSFDMWHNADALDTILRDNRVPPGDACPALVYAHYGALPVLLRELMPRGVVVVLLPDLIQPDPRWWDALLPAPRAGRPGPLAPLAAGPGRAPGRGPAAGGAAAGGPAPVPPGVAGMCLGVDPRRDGEERAQFVRMLRRAAGVPAAEWKHVSGVDLVTVQLPTAIGTLRRQLTGGAAGGAGGAGPGPGEPPGSPAAAGGAGGAGGWARVYNCPPEVGEALERGLAAWPVPAARGDPAAWWAGPGPGGPPRGLLWAPDKPSWAFDRAGHPDYEAFKYGMLPRGAWRYVVRVRGFGLRIVRTVVERGGGGSTKPRRGGGGGAGGGGRGGRATPPA